MTTRRGGRSSHVRPRPPSAGRPKPQRVRATAPDPYRLRQARGLEQRRKGLPLPTRVLLVVALAALGIVVFVTATGGVGALVGVLGRSLSGFVGDITATPLPSSSAIVAFDSPLITAPQEPYTNLATVDLQVTIPRDSVGQTTATVRIFRSVEEAPAVRLVEVAVGATTQLVVPVSLAAGKNDFTATIVQAGSESETSPVVTFVLDTEPPKITLASPKDGATVNGDTVELKGTTQPRTSLVARNEANGASITGLAGTDGTFTLVLAIGSGSNKIGITAIDPAGNTGTLGLTVKGGSGKLTAVVSASAYRIAVGALPKAIQLSVLVNDPDGNPLAGAAVTFTLTVPGVAPVTKEAVTGANGRASLTTTIPQGATPGSGVVTVVVTTDQFGSATAHATITILG